MGVHGLWKLLEPTGKSVALETLENKVLAVDVSIWLNQAVKGFRDGHGNLLPNAHLLGLFHRVCKLLYYRVKPVFVFDGGVPALKKQTLVARRQRKEQAVRDTRKTTVRLLKNLLHHQSLNKALGRRPEALIGMLRTNRKEKDMFELPPIEGNKKSENCTTPVSSSSDSEEEDTRAKHFTNRDLHSVDFESKNFRAMPLELQHDILTDLVETRKQSSWGKIHEMPQDSRDFSGFQMKRLLKRRALQERLDEISEEIGPQNTYTLDMLEQELGMFEAKPERIASDEKTEYILLQDLNSKTRDVKSRNLQKELPHDLGPNNSQHQKTENLSFPGSSGESEKDISLPGTSSSSLPGTSKQLFVGCNDDPSIAGVQKVDTVHISDSDDEIRMDDVEMADMELLKSQDFTQGNSGLTQEEILQIIQNENDFTPEEITAAIKSESMTDREQFQCDKAEVRTQSGGALCAAVAGTDIADVRLGVTSEDSRQSSSLESVKLTAKLEVLSLMQDTWSDNSDNESLETTRRGNCQLADSEVKVTDAASVPLACKQSSEVDNWMSDNNVVSVVSASVNKKIPKNMANNDQSVLISTAKNEGTALSFVASNRGSNPSRADTDKGSISPGTLSNKCHPGIEIVIDPASSQLDEDIFSDVFANPSESQTVFAACERVTASGYTDKSVQEIVEIVEENKIESSVRNKILCLEDSAMTWDELAAAADHETVDKHKNTQEGEKEEPSGDVMEFDTLVAQLKDEEMSPEVMEDELETSETQKTSRTVQMGSSKDTEPLTPAASDLSQEDLLKLQAGLEKEQSLLLTERGKQERLAATITDQMYTEAQELLRLFGIPYIIAPMEAEAQCAYLDMVSLTQGTITDDSDIWLFGGQRVYRNFFNRNRYVENYRDVDIFNCLHMNRMKLICLALLVGSDYTVGIESVGPVLALEILAEFPGEGLQSLQTFKQWWDKSEKGTLMIFQSKLKKRLQNLCVPTGFPSAEVIEAYLSPEVDKSKEKFTWGVPSVEALRDFALEKFGWSKKKIDDIINPVMTKVNLIETQRRIDSFFKAKPTISSDSQKISSQRVQKALQKFRVGEDAEEESSQAVIAPRPVRGRGQNPSDRKRNRQVGGNDGPTTVRDESVRESSVTRRIVKKMKKGPVIPLGDGGLIPQRVKDKEKAIGNKLKAVVLLRKSRLQMSKGRRKKCVKRIEMREAQLSESSDSN